MGMSREKAIDLLDNLIGMIEDNQNSDYDTALKMGIKALEQEPTTKNDLGVDCISRQAVLDLIADYDLSMGQVVRGIHALPSVKPQEPKTGRWEWVQYDYNPKLGNWHCSECRCIVIECVDKEEKGGIPLYKYCPQCGAKMQEAEIEG